MPAAFARLKKWTRWESKIEVSGAFEHLQDASALDDLVRRDPLKTLLFSTIFFWHIARE
ncbi:hypothetical protein [Achromobacter piechaudii]|uniref:hypothetical protein n=1 Tax=Achromobacter piechaudii TaxID=72556 RepID=UPI0012F4C3EB|nr:hypothetical protein [Achromobacter piechaudii]